MGWDGMGWDGMGWNTLYKVSPCLTIQLVYRYPTTKINITSYRIISQNLDFVL